MSLDDHGFVETDDSFRTTADGVYAIGDVSGPPMFTHSAREVADLLYRHLAKGEDVSTEDRTIPWGVFTDPQVGYVGLTEQEARDEGYDVGIGRQDFADQGKPKALGETEGFVKLVTDADTDELLGAHVERPSGCSPPLPGLALFLPFTISRYSRSRSTKSQIHIWYRSAVNRPVVTR